LIMIDEEVLVNMEKYGGSFVKQLAKLYRLADPVNKAKLENCFKDYFDEYHKRIVRKTVEVSDEGGVWK